MKDKLLIKVVVPIADLSYDTYLPINKKIGTIKKYLLNAIIEETEGYYNNSFDKVKLLDQETGKEYENDTFLYQSGIQNGSTIVLI